jgi:hypothetical protein
MATTTIGSNPGINDWMFDASMHQAWIQTYTPGTLGRMIQVAAYCAAQSGGGTGGAVAWIDGNPAFYTTSDGIGAGSGTSGAWHTTAADYSFSSGDNWEFGFYASRGVWVVYHADGGLTQVKGSAISNTSGGTNVSAYGAGSGSMSAYGTYFIVELYVRRSSAWVKSFLYVRRGSGWSLPPTYIWRSGSWTQVGRLAENLELRPNKMVEGYTRDRNGLYVPCRIGFEGPYYIGTGRDLHLHGEKILRPQPYVLSRAA